MLKHTRIYASFLVHVVFTNHKIYFRHIKQIKSIKYVRNHSKRVLGIRISVNIVVLDFGDGTIVFPYKKFFEMMISGVDLTLGR